MNLYRQNYLKAVGQWLGLSADRCRRSNYTGCSKHPYWHGDHALHLIAWRYHVRDDCLKCFLLQYYYSYSIARLATSPLFPHFFPF